MSNHKTTRSKHDRTGQDIAEALNRGLEREAAYNKGWTTASDITRALIDATDFAAKKHRGQKRKDAYGTPYINHPIKVVQLLSTVGGIRYGEGLIAGMLHDTIEDTGATAEEIEARFGKIVADIVMEVSDDKTLHKAERKRLKIETAARLSRAAKTVTLADKIANVTDLAYRPPVGWDNKRCQTYVDWASAVVDECADANSWLAAEFRLRAAEARAAQNPH
jgi:guanosine-3',5'-bis(diphosphate) 3'-pyrophosphohydrolase